MLKLQFLTIELFRGEKENSKGNASLKKPRSLP
jgi:hypothetical protein